MLRSHALVVRTRLSRKKFSQAFDVRQSLEIILTMLFAWMALLNGKWLFYLLEPHFGQSFRHRVHAALLAAVAAALASFSHGRCWSCSACVVL